MRSSQVVLAVILASVCGTLWCQSLLGAAPRVVFSGDDATLPTPFAPGLVSVTWQAPGGAILGLWWAQGPSGRSEGVAFGHVAHYGGRLNVTITQLRIAAAQSSDAGNYTVTAVTNTTSGDIIVRSVLVELRVYEDSSVKHGISEVLQEANGGLDDVPESPAAQRNADPCTAAGCMWEKSTDGHVYVPYVLSSQYSSVERSLIEGGMKSIHSSTCVRFRERQSERDYLSITSGKGCSSYIGRQGGEQQVSLQRMGCMYTSTIQHELLHALGFNHEHQRSDRDNHVRVYLENVEDGKERNFNKVATLNQNTAYDYSSVMHYDRLAFSKGTAPTLVPIPDSSVLIGQALSMSSADFTRVNRLYQCNELSVKVSIQSTAIEGESVTLQCTWATGAEKSITWKKDGVEITQGNRITVAGGLLGISSLQREDAGDYSCTVATDDTAETSRAMLTVHWKCLTLGGLIGIVIACIIVLCALCIAIVLLVRERKAQQKRNASYGIGNPNFKA
ncbi:hatching enzyme 1.2-like [Engraulis encrasicolus]|uniref:hatching enzyme 1.2-like n=1 Tax=Engraulis encrasicolus TaxID=184585 RepID=UPI002FD777D6